MSLSCITYCFGQMSSVFSVLFYRLVLPTDEKFAGTFHDAEADAAQTTSLANIFSCLISEVYS